MVQQYCDQNFSVDVIPHTFMILNVYLIVTGLSDKIAAVSFTNSLPEPRERISDYIP